MKMVNTNKFQASRTDMMYAVKKVQIELDRVYDDLAKIGEAEELAAISASIASLNYVMAKINDNIVGEV